MRDYKIRLMYIFVCSFSKGRNGFLRGPFKCYRSLRNAVGGVYGSVRISVTKVPGLFTLLLLAL